VAARRCWCSCSPFWRRWAAAVAPRAALISIRRRPVGSGVDGGAFAQVGARLSRGGDLVCRPCVVPHRQSPPPSSDNPKLKLFHRVSACRRERPAAARGHAPRASLLRAPLLCARGLPARRAAPAAALPALPVQPPRAICGARPQQRHAASPASRPPPHRRRGQQTAEGQDPLLWESDELTRIRQLHSRSFSDKAEFLKAPNLAAYLGLAPVDQIHLPLPLHIVFIGFQARAGPSLGRAGAGRTSHSGSAVPTRPACTRGELTTHKGPAVPPPTRPFSLPPHSHPRRTPTPPQGDGNAKVNIDAEALTEWFGQLDHLMPHARVALADLTCLDDGARPRGGAGPGGMDGVAVAPGGWSVEAAPSSPPPLHIHRAPSPHSPHHKLRPRTPRPRPLPRRPLRRPGRGLHRALAPALPRAPQLQLQRGRGHQSGSPGDVQQSDHRVWAARGPNLRSRRAPGAPGQGGPPARARRAAPRHCLWTRGGGTWRADAAGATSS
jgi:hypothetical protein